MAGLAAARPAVDARGGWLTVIPGNPIAAYEAPRGCRFAGRCGFVEDRCRDGRVALQPVASGHARCVRTEELRAARGAR